MADNRISRNDPCPCGSGRKFKACCLPKQSGLASPSSSSRHGSPFQGYQTAFGTTQLTVSPFAPVGIAPPPVRPGRARLTPDLKGKVFLADRMEWQEASLREVKPGQEFIAGSYLYKVRTADGIEGCPEVDVTKIPDADRPFDPDNWRTPKSFDVVYVLGTEYPNTGHWLMCDVQPHQRFAFQGRIYFLRPGQRAGVATLMDTGQVIRDRKAQLYVWVEYTAEDAFGKAFISYRYPKGRLIPLTNGNVVPVEELTPGLQFLLEPGGGATVTKVSSPEPWNPDDEFQDGFGNAFRRVIGTFRFEGWVQLMTVTVEGETHRVTPGHPYWSETRRGWYPIGSFGVGELLLTPEKVPVPIQAITPPSWMRETVYNIEVEEYHTYFVGRGLTAVWAHNGQGPVNCGVPQAARAESGKKANAGRAGLSEDPKFAAGYEAIFGKKPSGVDPKSLRVGGSTQPELFEGTVGGMRKAMRDNHEAFWRESVRKDGPVRILEVESMGNQRVLENGNHRFQAAMAENLPIPDWAIRVDRVKTWGGLTWPLDQMTRIPGLK